MVHQHIGIGWCTNSSNGTVFHLYVCFYMQINMKLFNDRKVFTTFVATVFLGKSSSDVFIAFIPSGFEIFAYRDFASNNTRYELFRTVSIAFSLLIN